jgi:hypothetical protein
MTQAANHNALNWADSQTANPIEPVAEWRSGGLPPGNDRAPLGAA